MDRQRVSQFIDSPAHAPKGERTTREGTQNRVVPGTSIGDRNAFGEGSNRTGYMYMYYAMYLSLSVSVCLHAGGKAAGRSLFWTARNGQRCVSSLRWWRRRAPERFGKLRRVVSWHIAMGDFKKYRDTWTPIKAEFSSPYSMCVPNSISLPRIKSRNCLFLSSVQSRRSPAESLHISTVPQSCKPASTNLQTGILFAR